LAGAFNAERYEAKIQELVAHAETTGDPPGVAMHEQDAHGSAEERTVAFELARDRGPDAGVEDLVDIVPGS